MLRSRRGRSGPRHSEGGAQGKRFVAGASGLCTTLHGRPVPFFYSSLDRLSHFGATGHVGRALLHRSEPCPVLGAAILPRPSVAKWSGGELACCLWVMRLWGMSWGDVRYSSCIMLLGVASAPFTPLRAFCTQRM